MKMKMKVANIIWNTIPIILTDSCHFKHIPQTTIQEISDENIMNSKKSLERHIKSLRKALDDAGVMQPSKDEIVNTVFNDDPFLKAKIQLNSEFKRTKYIQQSEYFVCPQEILLNKTEESHVVSFATVLTTWRHRFERGCE